MLGTGLDPSPLVETTLGYNAQMRQGDVWLRQNRFFISETSRKVRLAFPGVGAASSFDETNNPNTLHNILLQGRRRSRWTPSFVYQGEDLGPEPRTSNGGGLDSPAAKAQMESLAWAGDGTTSALEQAFFAQPGVPKPSTAAGLQSEDEDADWVEPAVEPEPEFRVHPESMQVLPPYMLARTRPSTTAQRPKTTAEGARSRAVRPSGERGAAPARDPRGAGKRASGLSRGIPEREAWQSVNVASLPPNPWGWSGPPPVPARRGSLSARGPRPKALRLHADRREPLSARGAPTSARSAASPSRLPPRDPFAVRPPRTPRGSVVFVDAGGGSDWGGKGGEGGEGDAAPTGVGPARLRTPRQQEALQRSAQTYDRLVVMQRELAPTRHVPA